MCLKGRLVAVDFYLISPSSPVSMLTLPIMTMAAAILAFHALAASA
jgi:hypothetical protein